jgi:hypothetical protein
VHDALAMEQPTAVAAPSNILDVIERTAANPNVDTGKLEKIIELQERILRYQAEQAFARDFIELQQALPVVDRNGEGHNEVSYARLEDIITAVRPVLHQHGFSLAHRTEWAEGRARVIAILTHRDGHSRTSEFIAAPDTSGGKNAIQAHGSTMSYGRRYTTLDVLGIVTRDADDDGETATIPEPPAGYAEWVHDLECSSDDGLEALQRAWSQSKPEYRRFRTQYQPSMHAALKKRAAQMDAKPKKGQA